MNFIAIIILLIIAVLTIAAVWRNKSTNNQDFYADNANSRNQSNWQEPVLDLNDADENVSSPRTISTPTVNKSNQDADDSSLKSLGFGTTSVDEMLKPVTSRSKQSAKQRETYLPSDDDLIVIHVKAAPGSVFSGYGLQQALTAAGLRFGELSIFHRYEFDSGKERIIFSVASAVEPGVFDLQRIGGFATPGLSIFMTIANCSDPVKTFEILIDTAQQLADDLGGVLYDQHRKLFAEDTINDYRARVKELALI